MQIEIHIKYKFNDIIYIVMISLIALYCYNKAVVAFFIIMIIYIILGIIKIISMKKVV